MTARPPAFRRLGEMEFSGVYTALATPFLEPSGEIDWPAFEALVRAQAAAGVAGVVVIGTTGESPTLSKDEKKALISRAVEVARVSAPALRVVAGTGSNNTAESVDLTQYARDAGAHACLVVNPYYNRPSQAGLAAHVRAIAAVGLPIVLYNIPGRSGVNLNVATAAELARICPEVRAIKDATGNVEQAAELALACPGLTVLSGDDGLTLPFMSVGARGVVSVVSNVAPAALVRMVALANANDFAGARALHEKLLPLVKAMFVETNPVPVKAALAQLGAFGSAHVRLPLAPLLPESAAKVRAAVDAAKAAGVL